MKKVLFCLLVFTITAPSFAKAASLGNMFNLECSYYDDNGKERRPVVMTDLYIPQGKEYPTRMTLSVAYILPGQAKKIESANVLNVMYNPGVAGDFDGSLYAITVLAKTQSGKIVEIVIDMDANQRSSMLVNGAPQSHMNYLTCYPGLAG